jgi:DNA polymerase III sliding clamp (beta) subunit (PCNA family)
MKITLCPGEVIEAFNSKYKIESIKSLDCDESVVKLTKLDDGADVTIGLSNLIVEMKNCQMQNN